MRFKTAFSIRLFITLFLTTFILSCEKEEPSDPPPTPSPSLNSFWLESKYNAGLDGIVNFEIVDKQISGRLPFAVDITGLVASFDLNNGTFAVNGITQISGQTANDFSQPLTYTLYGRDGSVEEYVVDATDFTGLPLIYISTDGNVEIDSKDYYFPGTAEIKGGKAFDDVLGAMQIRGRGHSTWWVHPKKPYQLKFDDKTAILGMPADKKWIFLAEYSDKTMIRNKLAFEMGNISNLEWTPQSEYAEVFVNNNYRGTYNVTQKVEESSNRLPLGDHGFLCEIDTPDHLEEGDVSFTSNHFTVQIKEPELESGSTQYEFIKNYVTEFETVLYSDDFNDPDIGYRKYVDVESFVEWYLINEIAKNQDARSYSSMYFTLIPGQKIKMGPLWDFDLGFGNVDYSECEYNTNFWVKYHAWISRMFDDPAFAAAVKQRFQFFKDNQAYLLDFIDSQAERLYYAQKENDKRWDLIGRYVWPNPVVYNSYQEEVNHLKEWFSGRMDWLDAAYQEIEMPQAE